MKWNKVILQKDGMPIKAYVNHDNTRAVTFPLFGKYNSFCSDQSALDLAVETIFHIGSDELMPCRLISYDQYLNSQEDTEILSMEAA